MKKRLLSALLAVCMVTAILPTFSSTAFAAGTVTRSEWISRLVEAFSMTVESDDNMPDNYFSDISEDDSCYQDILLAVEFGVIDLEAGEAFEPDADATREFAAQTLNSCLMFQLDEGTEYTYSEADSVTYPDDIQVAVNRGWFALSGKNFLPEQAVTTAEADAMIADAKEVIAGDVIDENHENTYEFAEGVIEIPETANTVIDADNTVTITDYDAQISEGDIFVVYASGLPVVLKAVTVETVDNVTTVTSTTGGTEDAITSAAAEGVAAVDLEAFQADEVSTYSVIDTSDSNAEYEELSIELQSIEYDKKANRLIMSKSVKLGSAAVGSINVTINDFKAPYKVDVLLGEYSIDILGNAVVTTNIKVDFGEYAGIPSSIPLGTIPVAGVGDISLEMQYSLKGDVTATWSGYLDTGASYSRFNGGFRNHLSFDKKDFSICAKAELSAGLKLSASINLLNIVKGSAWITSGARMSFSATGYNSGTPKLCVTTQGYLYASAGVSITIDYFLDAKTFSKPIDIYTASNSPIRVVYHYEDDQQVSSCTRGQSLKYTTSYNSRYFNPYSGQSSYGGSGGSAGGTAEPVVIWEYEVENDGNATITKYSGNASAVVIPEKIDGYTVTRIGTGAFENNKFIRTVSVPNSVTEIYNRAFLGCSNLTHINLSKQLDALGNRAFWECTSLYEIEIPKTLTRTIYDSYASGPFNKSGLVSAVFEDGSTQVISNLFEGASYLEHVTLSDTITKIGSSAFEDCTSLKNIFIPNSVNEIGNRAFWECSSLDSINLSKNLIALGSLAFWGCSDLRRIEIPKSLKQTLYDGYDSGPFNNSGLQVATFEEGTTQVITSLFKGAKQLTDIELLDTITNIGSTAFQDCVALSNINIPYSVITIESAAFAGCTSLKTIDIPDSVTTISNRVFAGCTNLNDVRLSKNLTALGNLAFYKCESLASIKIPKSVETTVYDGYDSGPFNDSGLQEAYFEEGTTRVISSFFKDAHNLKKVELVDTITAIDSSAFEDCTTLETLNIPSSVTIIKDHAFKNCTSLNNMRLPNSIKEIEQYAFENIGVQTIVLPQAIQYIAEGLFYSSKNLSSIEIPPTVTLIKYDSFNNCSALKDVFLPDALKTIETSAFENCTALNEINIPDSMQTIGSSVFKNCDALTEIKTDMSGTIGAQAFYDCDALTTLELGDGATEIGREMCYGCDKLSTVKLGKYITTIPDSAFRLCQSLETITLPRFCTTVAANAFAEDVKLASAYVPVSVSEIETNSFSYPMKMTMYGKSGSYAEEYADSRNMAFNAVNAPITNIKYADSSMSISRKATVRPQLDIEPAFDTGVVTFSTSDNKILTVSDTGLVKGVNYGTATITATTDSGKSTSIEITVLKTADRLELDKTSLSLEAGQAENLTVTMTPADAADKLNWSSSNTAVATVDGNGKVTAAGVGTAVITVTAEYSSVSASCTVEVVGDVTITASAGEHGKITPSGEVSVKSNAKTTFTIIPDYGYVVKDVQVNGASVGAVESYTFSNPKENATIHADFAAVNVSYENGDVVITSEAKLDNLKLIIAEYNDDNSLSDCKIETVTAEPNVEHHVSVSTTGKYKLMLWSSMDTMRPIWMHESV